MILDEVWLESPVTMPPHGERHRPEASFQR
jgi:hypothetical protein